MCARKTLVEFPLRVRSPARRRRGSLAALPRRDTHTGTKTCRGSTRYRHPTNGRAIRRSPAGPLNLMRFAPVEAAGSNLPATFQKENTILTDGVSFCDCPHVLLSALPPTARKGMCARKTLVEFPLRVRSPARRQRGSLAALPRRDTHTGTKTCPRHVFLAALVPFRASARSVSQKKDHPLGGPFFVERATRLELATSTLARSRSTR